MLTGNGGAGYSFDGPLTDDDEKKIGIMGGMCGCWTREEFGVIQYVNRQWGCGLVQFSLLFFLPKALVLALL